MIDDWLTTSVPVSHSESEDPGKKNVPDKAALPDEIFVGLCRQVRGVPGWGGVEEERSPMDRGVRTVNVRRDLGHV